MRAETFFVEIGTEELPPKSLRKLAEAFLSHFQKGLESLDITYGKTHWYATPRRLALKIEDVEQLQPNKLIERRGPATSQAFDASGNLTKAAEGWAKGCGITVAEADRLVTDKGEWLIYREEVKGKAVQELLPELVTQALQKLPIAKPMRWGNNKTLFIRPVHTVTMFYGAQRLAGTILGVNADNHILGHRFMGEPILKIESAEEYPEILYQRGCVVADYEQRKASIKKQIAQAEISLGGVIKPDDALLEEVTSLVEWPVVLTAEFDPKFLSVPAEALVHTMKSDQKYFPVYDKQGNLQAKFIFVANINSKNTQMIISGNERVIRPRLADAEFFYKTDLKQKLEDRLPRLETVLFQQKLGNLLEKSKRIQRLAIWIAEQIDADSNSASRAGLLSKCDLMTNMVFEFPETQGVIGMYYARNDGEKEEVALALNEQYLPRFAGDVLPSTLVSCAVAIADKVDTLVGIFGIGQQPKGDNDPFALRRAALGMLRIIVDRKLAIDLRMLLSFAETLYPTQLTNNAVVDEVLVFLFARFRAWYQDEGYRADVIQAVLARQPTKPLDFDLRVKAVTHFKTLPESQLLAEANKRVANILSKVTVVEKRRVQAVLLKEKSEITLAANLAVMEDKLPPLLEQEKYQEALSELLTLRDPLDNFFASVMVMVEDETLKQNRLALLQQIRALFLQITDISLLQW